MMLDEEGMRAGTRNILDAAGGSVNIESANCCATRLRLCFFDLEKVDLPRLKTLEGSAGLLVKGREYQLVLGFKAASYCRLIRRAMESDNSPLYPLR